MTENKITHRQAQALARFIHELRPDWDAPGITNAIGDARTVGPASLVACAAIRAAVTLANRTPAVIALEGPHWRPTETFAPRFTGPTSAERCSVCSEREDRCRSRWASDHAFESAAHAARRKADAQQAKAITDALRAEIQPLGGTQETTPPGAATPDGATPTTDPSEVTS